MFSVVMYRACSNVELSTAEMGLFSVPMHLFMFALWHTVLCQLGTHKSESSRMGGMIACSAAVSGFVNSVSRFQIQLDTCVFSYHCSLSVHSKCQ
jgi:hypothetical protein